jgi:DNA-binding transcriptional MerR regulator
MTLRPNRREKNSIGVRRLSKIGTLARELGVSPSIIRAWERLGLARPIRTKNGYRFYTPNDTRVLKRAVYMRKVLGLNAQAILLQLRQDGVLPGNPSKASDGLVLGNKFRKLRQERSESLAEVARAVEVSTGFISNLERGQEQASIRVLRSLARHYGVNIVDLFTKVNENAPPLVTPTERKVLSGGPGVRMDLLAWGKIMMEPHIFHIAAKAGSPDFYSHEGEEFMYVIAGELLIHLQEKVYELKTGDSFYFASHIPHRWINPGKTETQILWINTPPTF